LIESLFRFALSRRAERPHSRRDLRESIEAEAQVIRPQLAIDLEHGVRGEAGPEVAPLEGAGEARRLERIDTEPERRAPADRAPDQGALVDRHQLAELVTAEEPVDPTRDRGRGRHAQGALEREEGHRRHAVLMHRVDGVEIDQAAGADVVVPTPLSERVLVGKQELADPAGDRARLGIADHSVAPEGGDDRVDLGVEEAELRVQGALEGLAGAWDLGPLAAPSRQVAASGRVERPGEAEQPGCAAMAEQLPEGSIEPGFDLALRAYARGQRLREASHDPGEIRGVDDRAAAVAHVALELEQIPEGALRERASVARGSPEDEPEITGVVDAGQRGRERLVELLKVDGWREPVGVGALDAKGRDGGVADARSSRGERLSSEAENDEAGRRVDHPREAGESDGAEFIDVQVITGEVDIRRSGHEELDALPGTAITAPAGSGMGTGRNEIPTEALKKGLAASTRARLEVVTLAPPMPRTYPDLATADEIRQIARRAEELLDAVFGADEEDDDIDDTERVIREGQRIQAAIGALRFCALAAGELGDPKLLPIVAQAIETSKHVDDHSDDHPTTFGVGLTLLLQAGTPADQDVKRLAQDRDARIREAVAEGLTPRGEAEIALLEALSTDGIAQVRNAAKKALAKVHDVAWWKGKFASDPIPRIAPEEAPRHKATLERLSDILELPHYALTDQEPELVKLAGSLPDPLAVEVAEVLLATPDPYGPRLHLLGAMMLERPGGAAAFIRICEALCKHPRSSRYGGLLSRMLEPLPRERKISVCRELTDFAIQLPDEARCEQTGTPARVIAEIVGKSWPEDEDPTPLLDALLTLPRKQPHTIDWVVAKIKEVFTREGMDPAPILDRALEARSAGYPGSWLNLSSAMDKLLERASGPALRAAAERAILSDSEDDVRWGIERLLGNARDPARDPPPAEMVIRFLAEPRYRKAMKDSHELRQLAAPALRADLREGRLAFMDAASAMNILGSLYGGVAQPNFLPRALWHVNERAEEGRQEKLAAIEAFLGPPELRGPPTDAEWQALRHARAQYLATEGHDIGKILTALPEGSWHPDDRAALDLVVRAFQGGDEGLSVEIALALTAKPEEANLPLADLLVEQSGPKYRRILRRCRGLLRDALGLEDNPPADLAQKDAQGDDKDDW
jgi:hypothetical protein